MNLNLSTDKLDTGVGRFMFKYVIFIGNDSGHFQKVQSTSLK